MHRTFHAVDEGAGTRKSWKYKFAIVGTGRLGGLERAGHRWSRRIAEPDRCRSDEGTSVLYPWPRPWTGQLTTHGTIARCSSRRLVCAPHLHRPPTLHPWNSRLHMHELTGSLTSSTFQTFDLPVALVLATISSLLGSCHDLASSCTSYCYGGSTVQIKTHAWRRPESCIRAVPMTAHPIKPSQGRVPCRTISQPSLPFVTLDSSS